MSAPAGPCLTLFVFMLSIQPVSAGTSDVRVPPPERYTAQRYPERLQRNVTICPKVSSSGSVGIVIACSKLFRGICYIYVSPLLADEYVPMAIVHERAHCNGWPASHPRP